MEFRHLRYFMALAEEGNFGRAAKRVHISQPPLTRQIRQLEEEFGARLFERTPKGVELTEAGRLFREEAVKILALAQLTGEKTRMAARGELGRRELLDVLCQQGVPVLGRQRGERRADQLLRLGEIEQNLGVAGP